MRVARLEPNNKVWTVDNAATVYLGIGQLFESRS